MPGMRPPQITTFFFNTEVNYANGAIAKTSPAQLVIQPSYTPVKVEAASYTLFRSTNTPGRMAYSNHLDYLINISHSTMDQMQDLPKTPGFIEVRARLCNQKIEAGAGTGLGNKYQGHLAFIRRQGAQIKPAISSMRIHKVEGKSGPLYVTGMRYSGK